MTMLQDGVDDGSPLGSDKRSFAPYPTAVAEARRFATDTAARWGITQRAGDIRLCVSELGTNAIVHAAAPKSGFTLRILAWTQRLRVEVEDQGGGLPVQRTARFEDTSGRGLLLVDVLSDDWGVVEGPRGKTVWCDFMLKPDAGWTAGAVAC